jgi:hypothetical protein
MPNMRIKPTAYCAIELRHGFQASVYGRSMRQLMLDVMCFKNNRHPSQTDKMAALCDSV